MHRSSSHLSDDSSVVQQPEILEVITKVYAAGICCPSEVGIVHRVLEGLPGELGSVNLGNHDRRLRDVMTQLQCACVHILAACLPKAGLLSSMFPAGIGLPCAVSSLDDRVGRGAVR